VSKYWSRKGRGARGSYPTLLPLSARRLVCDAIVEMMLTIEPIRSAVLFNERIACRERCVSSTAALAISRPRVASWPIC